MSVVLCSAAERTAGMLRERQAALIATTGTGLLLDSFWRRWRTARSNPMPPTRGRNMRDTCHSGRDVAEEFLFDGYLMKGLFRSDMRTKYWP